VFRRPEPCANTARRVWSKGSSIPFAISRSLNFSWDELLSSFWAVPGIGAQLENNIGALLLQESACARLSTSRPVVKPRAFQVKIWRKGDSERSIREKPRSILTWTRHRLQDSWYKPINGYVRLNVNELSEASESHDESPSMIQSEKDGTVFRILFSSEIDRQRGDEALFSRNSQGSPCAYYRAVCTFNICIGTRLWTSRVEIKSAHNCVYRESDRDTSCSFQWKQL